MKAVKSIQEAFQLRSTVAVLGFSVRTLSEMIKDEKLIESIKEYAKNNKNNGIVAIEFDQLKRTVNDNIDIPITEPVIQKRVTGLLPYLSLISPIKGEAVN